MKKREERSKVSDRVVSQLTFDFGDEAEPQRRANLLRQELTDPAPDGTPSLSVSIEVGLLSLKQLWADLAPLRGTA